LTLKPDLENAVIPSYDHPVKLEYTVGFRSEPGENYDDALGDPGYTPPYTPSGPREGDFHTCAEPDGTVVQARKRSSTTNVTVTLRNHGTPPKGVAGVLGTALKPSGKKAKIRAILKAGGYAATLKLPSAGRATVSWYFVPKGANVGDRKSVVVASGSKAVAGKGKAKLKIKLSRKGRALLKKSKSIKLTALGSFQPKNAQVASTTKVFKLKR
jgi:hypothetical protein